MALPCEAVQVDVFRDTVICLTCSSCEASWQLAIGNANIKQNAEQQAENSIEG